MEGGRAHGNTTGLERDGSRAISGSITCYWAYVVTLALLYNSSPEESLHIPIEFLTVECASIEILIVMKVITGIVKPNCPGSGRSKAVVGGVVSGSSATVHL